MFVGSEPCRVVTEAPAPVLLLLPRATQTLGLSGPEALTVLVGRPQVLRGFLLCRLVHSPGGMRLFPLEGRGTAWIWCEGSGPRHPAPGRLEDRHTLPVAPSLPGLPRGGQLVSPSPESRWGLRSCHRCFPPPAPHPSTTPRGCEDYTASGEPHSDPAVCGRGGAG